MDVLRVLVVDNDRDTADTMAMLLRHSSCEVSVFYNGLSAIEEARRFRPHAMLVDLALPAIDGYEVAERIRERPELDDVFLAALTGYADKKHHDVGLAAGFDEYLVKPISLDSLGTFLEKVRKIFNEIRAERPTPA
jgi:CheY-like chemotaxis protein